MPDYPPADPDRFAEAMAEQEWRMRVRLSDTLYYWLDQESKRRGYARHYDVHQRQMPQEE